MAAGLPLVTSNIHGIVDYSVDGVTGYCCNPDDADQFAVLIDRLIKNEDVRRTMGEHNFDIAKRYDRANVTKKMKSIYQDV